MCSSLSLLAGSQAGYSSLPHSGASAVELSSLPVHVSMVGFVFQLLASTQHSQTVAQKQSVLLSRRMLGSSISVDVTLYSTNSACQQYLVVALLVPQYSSVAIP